MMTADENLEVNTLSSCSDPKSSEAMMMGFWTGFFALFA